MSCTNCYNGCSEINSDQCIKYTGIDVPGLGITNGDTLLSIEETIFNYIQSFMIGEEIVPTIDPSILCTIINDNLPICSGCTGISLNDILTAIIKSVCDLETEIANINSELDILNADYTIGCLTGVTASSDTHAILQAVITNLCSLNTAFSALVSQLNLTNITTLNINAYIASYLASQPSSNSASARMVPYCPIAYYGPLAGYPTPSDGLSLTGQGIGYWTKVYLCNGATPGVPDLRGRAIVGTTIMGNNAFPSQTDPCGACTTCANPLYELGTVAGSNCVTLTIPQLPNHTHLNTATTILTPETHNHTYVKTDQSNTPGNGVNIGYVGVGDDKRIGGSLVNTGDVTITAATTLINAAVGSGNSHLNTQPVMGLHYIMYIP